MKKSEVITLICGIACLVGLLGFFTISSKIAKAEREAKKAQETLVVMEQREAYARKEAAAQAERQSLKEQEEREGSQAAESDTPTSERTSNTTNKSTQKVQSKMGTVELIDARLAPFKNAATGKLGQEVLTTWKNTGESNVRVVDAEIISLNGDGSTRESFNYTLYAEFDDSPGVLPGETHETQAGRGFKLPGFEGFPGYSPAASVKVRITKVAEKSGM